MHLLGQVDQVRLLGPYGLTGPPLALSRRKSTPGRLAPFRHPEWHRSAAGVWMPVPEVWGGAGFSGSWQWQRVAFGQYGSAASTQTTQNLSVLYLFGVTGNVGGGRIRLLTAKTVNNIYFFITAYGGTAANVTDIDVELRNDTSNKPGSTTHIGTTINPASATGWINKSGLSFAASADTAYWVSIGDSINATIATDFATLLLRCINGTSPGDFDQGDRMAADSTNGWSTTTLRSGGLSMVVTMSDGTSIGNPFSATAAPSSATNRKGLLIGALTESLKVLGMVAYPGGSANYTGVELWSGTGGPSGTADATGVHDMYGGSSTTLAGFLFATPQTLAKATQYRLVFTYGSATALPRKLSIGTGADANLRAAMLGGGGWYWTEANATTDWSNDDTSSWPQVAVVIEDQVAVSSGGGLRQAGHGGLAA